VVTSDSGSFRKNSLSKLMTTLTSCHLSLSRFNPTGSCKHPMLQTYQLLSQYVTSFFVCTLISIRTNLQMCKQKKISLGEKTKKTEKLYTCHTTHYNSYKTTTTTILRPIYGQLLLNDKMNQKRSMLQKRSYTAACPC